MRVSSAFQGMIQVLRTGSLNGTLGLVWLESDGKLRVSPAFTLQI
jgi:hypothetical protein